MATPLFSNRRGGRSQNTTSLTTSLCRPDAAGLRPERARGRRLFYLLLAAWIINLFDLGFTLLAQEQRVLEELNPVAAHVLPYGPVAVAVYKLALLGLGTTILWVCRHLPIAESTAWIYAILCFALAVQWHHFYRNAPANQLVEQTTLKLIPPVDPLSSATNMRKSRTAQYGLRVQKSQSPKPLHDRMRGIFEPSAADRPGAPSPSSDDEEALQTTSQATGQATGQTTGPKHIINSEK